MWYEEVKGLVHDGGDEQRELESCENLRLAGVCCRAYELLAPESWCVFKVQMRK